MLFFLNVGQKSSLTLTLTSEDKSKVSIIFAVKGYPWHNPFDLDLSNPLHSLNVGQIWPLTLTYEVKSKVVIMFVAQNYPGYPYFNLELYKTLKSLDFNLAWPLSLGCTYKQTRLKQSRALEDPSTSNKPLCGNNLHKYQSLKYCPRCRPIYLCRTFLTYITVTENNLRVLAIWLAIFH